MEHIQPFVENMRKMQFQMRRIIDFVSAKEALTPPMIFLLFHLAHRGPLKVTDIADLFAITSGAATGFSDKMEQLGLVQKTRSDEDRRVVCVTLTGKGEEKVRQMKERLLEMYGEVFREVEAEELNRMTQTLERISDLLEQFMDHQERKR
ncbi:MarR family transcriptional regulator [Brevibacillus sp. SYP-B805]|uniref:MarR family winged helix-turn-helix transcriptional regulator n=1 Tax=Brevibacillus sp. SYP-B805 TaxID=1578199 RepID=UPI0013ECD6E7|nr:MarR family transcriptional regulator [Brevibacillus sp. SYP-B805]NGQ94914.1 MarR family transcriptional regulator [Brevibacillus sp. SYP-B805]